jgi:hypothetical protein
MSLRKLVVIAVAALGLLSTQASADCQHDGKTEGEGGVVEFADHVARQCVNSVWIKVEDVPDPSKVRIFSATYGLDAPPVACDLTQKLRDVCDGKNECLFPVTNEFMCGRDILPGPAKRLIITWQCGSTSKTERVNERPSGPNYRIVCGH